MNERSKYKDIIIAFYTPQIDVRGTCVALFDYANYFERLYGGKSIILVPEECKSDQIAVFKFMNRFPVYYFKDIEGMEKLLLQYDCNILYTIKYGKNDGLYSKSVPTCVHWVFDMSESHGRVYAAVSSAVSEKYNNSYKTAQLKILSLKALQTGDILGNFCIKA